MTPEQGERKLTDRLGVHEETQRLRDVLMWGRPGAEAAMGQVLPTKISCFQDEFNVPQARKEWERARQILEGKGVHVIVVKDLYADMLGKNRIKPEFTLAQLRDKLRQQAVLFNEWRETKWRHIDPKRETKKLTPTKLQEIVSWINFALDEDVEQYGEAIAIEMNRELCLGHEYPLANVVYARDQSNLLGNVFVWSSFEHEIRQHEVSLFRKILDDAGILDGDKIEQVQVFGNGRFEGGDGIVNHGIVYIGCGGRTNQEGILQIAPAILKGGYRVLVPYDEKRARGEANEMDAMHLDTIWMPCGENEVAFCEEEVLRRELLEVVYEAGICKLVSRGRFIDHLVQRGVTIVPIDKAEQVNYAPNFLNIGDGQIVLSLGKKSCLKGRLESRGKKVVDADLDNITKGYGGLHCMTAAIRRG